MTISWEAGRRARAAAAVLAGLVALSPLARAAAQQKPKGGAAADSARPAVVKADSGFSFDFQQADLSVVLTSLAEAAGLSIVYSGLPNRTVTLRTSHPVSAREVDGLLESVARSNGLTLDRQADILRISGGEAGPGAGGAAQGAAAAQDHAAAAGPVRLFVLTLKHAKAESLGRTLQALFGGGMDGGGGGGYGAGGLGGMDEGLSGGLSAAADQGDLSLSQSLSRQRSAGYQAMQPASPAAPQRAAPPPAGRRGGQEPGMNALLEGPVEIVPDARSNSLLVLASPHDYQTIEAAVEKLDQRPLQVLIEVLIAEVRRDKNLALGTSVDVPVKNDDGVGFQLQGLSAGDVALQVLGIGSVGASTVLRALASSSNTRILSRPVVLAQNNQEARILVGDQRPFVQLFRSLPTDQAVRDQVVQYKNVGTELRIVPTINRDGYVNLQVRQEVSSATSEVQFGAPVINTRESDTQVLIKDGHTAVLGGLISHQTVDTNSGIPLLKDIPVLGGLFGSTSHRKIATELFILLTPHVISSDQQMDDAARDVRSSTDEIRHVLSDTSFTLGSGPDTTGLPSPDTVPGGPVGGADGSGGGGGR